MGAGNRISMLCLGEAIGHGLYDWILQRTETAQTQRWIAAECGREGLLENSKDGGLKHLTTTYMRIQVVVLSLCTRTSVVRELVGIASVLTLSASLQKLPRIAIGT